MTYTSNVSVVYNRIVPCKNYTRIFCYGDCIEKICIRRVREKVYYNIKIIKLCRFGFMVYRKRYVIDLI